ncbi:MAG: 50S ribosomal protein L7ae [Nanoarchaeota archaeon]|jgi:large subunit ribosomal protein L7Ae|nr:50S ribosomal protein L7ae [Nanoarchaeota archaeon]|tara:strand:- start:23096 stop:23467 length:372 start_codon:yes stop_codon:yes gene_type:complete
MPLKFNFEPNKELSEKALEAVEVARSSGKIKKGTNEVTKTVERGVAKLVVIAQDTQPEEVIMHIPALCQEKSIPCVPVPTKTELGAAAGLQLGCASVAVTEEGDSKKLIAEISKLTGSEKKGE